jgi:hypothetical protein
MALQYMTITKDKKKMEAPPRYRRRRRAWKVFQIFFESSYELIYFSIDFIFCTRTIIRSTSRIHASYILFV